MIYNLLIRWNHQQDRGGPVRVPLDEAWAMHGRFAAPDVRESLLALAAHLSPVEVLACLDKVAIFRAVKRPPKTSSTKWARVSKDTKTI